MERKDYVYQAKANIEALCKEEEYSNRKEVLRKIQQAFDDEGVKWALAWGTSLFLNGIVDNFTDFDIIVDDESICKLKPIMEKLGAKIEEKQNGKCFTTILFLQCELDGVNVDAMACFSIEGEKMDYHYNFSTDDVIYRKVEDSMIPILVPEVEYILYFVLEVEWQPQRRHKRLLVQEFLNNNGLEFEIAFERALEQKLPKKIKFQIRSLIYNN